MTGIFFGNCLILLKLLYLGMYELNPEHQQAYQHKQNRQP